MLSPAVKGIYCMIFLTLILIGIIKILSLNDIGLNNSVQAKGEHTIVVSSQQVYYYFTSLNILS